MGEAAAAAGFPGEMAAAAALREVEAEEGEASRAAAREGEACGAAAALGGRALTGEAAAASDTFEGEAGGGCGGTASEERTTSPHSRIWWPAAYRYRTYIGHAPQRMARINQWPG